MAQRWYEMATGLTMDFNAIVQDFNDQQLAKPVTQQQQQVQPKKEGE
jgi:hypothetical protein